MAGYIQGKMYVNSSVYIVETHMVELRRRFIHDGINIQIVHIIMIE